MASNIKVRKRTATKRNRSTSRGTAKRKHVAVRSSGRGVATAAFVGKKR